MKKLFLSGVVALFLATGTAHAQMGEEDNGSCLGPDATKIPCTQLGRLYKCDGADVDAADNVVDEIYIRHNHLLSDLSSHTITIYTRTGSGRRHRSTEPRFRYPIVHYDVHTGKLTLNGKRCRLYCKPGMECE